MKTENFDHKESKHPIPHAKGVTDKDNKTVKSVKTGEDLKNSKSEEE
jgi:hypothetical protein